MYQSNPGKANHLRPGSDSPLGNSYDTPERRSHSGKARVFFRAKRCVESLVRLGGPAAPKQWQMASSGLAAEAICILFDLISWSVEILCSSSLNTL